MSAKSKKKPRAEKKQEPQASQKRRSDLFVYIALLLSASVLILCNLGNRYLWQDEAQTALISKTILSHGVPLGYDGQNCLSQDNGAEYGPNHVWRYHTWLPFYVLAAFFKLFGISTFVARLPFALFGIATVLLTYKFGKTMWESRRAGLLAASAMLLSIPFFLVTRQCRYYAPATFFSVLGLYAYYNVLCGKKYSSVMFVAAAVLLFHTQYLHYGALVGAVVIHSLICRRDKLALVALLAGATVVLNLPWMVWIASLPASYAKVRGTPTFHTESFWQFMLVYGTETVRYVFTPFLLIVALVVFGLNRRSKPRSCKPLDRAWQNLLLLALFILINAAIHGFLGPFPTFRHIAPSAPAFYLIMAFILEEAWRQHVALAAAGLILIAATQPIGSYLYEITHDFKGPVEGIVGYLNEHAKPGETIVTTYDDLPLKFYTRLKVLGGLTGEDLSATKQADWVIIRRYIINAEQDRIIRYLNSNLQQIKFQSIKLDCPDLIWGNRESPEDHVYKLTGDEPPVVVFHRIGK